MYVICINALFRLLIFICKLAVGFSTFHIYSTFLLVFFILCLNIHSVFGFVACWLRAWFLRFIVGMIVVVKCFPSNVCYSFFFLKIFIYIHCLLTSNITN